MNESIGTENMDPADGKEKADRKICPECGTELNPDALFCPKCGIKTG